MIAPTNIHIIEYFGLPSARTRFAPPLAIIKNGNPHRVMPVYSSAYPKTSGVAPKNRIIGSSNIKENKLNRIPLSSKSATAFPTKCLARSLSPAPMQRLKLAAPPTPNSRQRATHTVLKGKATLVAAFPRTPTLCPIKIWSTILYKALTCMAMMLGTANFNRSCPIGCVPRIFPCLFSIA